MCNGRTNFLSIFRFVRGWWVRICGSARSFPGKSSLHVRWAAAGRVWITMTLWLCFSANTCKAKVSNQLWGYSVPERARTDMLARSECTCAKPSRSWGNRVHSVGPGPFATHIAPLCDLGSRKGTDSRRQFLIKCNGSRSDGYVISTILQSSASDQR